MGTAFIKRREIFVPCSICVLIQGLDLTLACVELQFRKPQAATSVSRSLGHTMWNYSWNRNYLLSDIIFQNPRKHSTPYSSLLRIVGKVHPLRQN